MSSFGIQIGLDVAAYHKRELGVVSKHALDLVDRSPAHYRAWVDGLDGKQTPAMAFGTAWHMALLEPARFATTYAIRPDFGDCRYKAAKAARDAWLEDNAGRASLGVDDAERIDAMLDAVKAHPAASKLIDDGESEVSIRWVDAESGLTCKSRADYWVPNKRLIVDAKSCEDASPEGFSRAVARYRYHVQDALYRSGFAALGEPIEHFAMLAVETEAPFAVAVYTLDTEAVTKGYSLARGNIATLRECMERDEWIAYSNGVQELNLPRWAA